MLNSLYSLTQATDTSNIRLVFAAIKETILQNALKDSGILDGPTRKEEPTESVPDENEGNDTNGHGE